MRIQGIIAIIALLFSTYTYAQNDLDIENVDVVKNFEFILQESSMVKPQIVIPEVKKSPHAYGYELSIVPLDIEYPAPYIRPVAMVPDKAPTWKNGYIKAGYGNLKNPFGQVRANFHAEDYYDIGVEANYRAFDDVDILDKKYVNGNGNLNIDYKVTQELTANINLRGGVEEFHFFGFNEVAMNLPVDNARKFQHGGLTLGLSSKIDEINRFGFGINTKYDQVRLTDINAKEHNIFGQGHIGYQLGKKTILHVEGMADLTYLEGDNEDELHFYGLRPFIQFGSRKINAKMGGNIMYDATKTHFFPDILLSYKLISDEIVLQLGANGDLQKYNYTHLQGLNGFVSPISDILFYKFYEVFGGIHGQFSAKVQYDAKAGYRYTENYGLFVNDFARSRRQFILEHDDLGMSFINGSVKVEMSKILTFGANVNVNVYNTDIVEKPWHLPALELDGYGIVSLMDDKLSLRADLHIQDRIDYLQEDGTAAKSNVLYDFSAKLDYSPVNAFAIFLEGQNLLNSEYERWHGYFNFGSHILGGVKLAF